MKLEHLATFDAVARLRNFTAAADELFITQPSLSRQIANLEHDLGAILFERGRHGATLTEAGERLLPIARRMLADADAAHGEMRELAGLASGRVRLGAPPTLCGTVVADALAEFTRAHPGVDVEVKEAGSRALVDALAEGALDLALTITRGAQRFDAVDSVALFTERLVLASTAAAGVPAHRLSLREVAEVPLIAFNRSYDLRLATDAAFASAGLSPRFVVEGGEMDAVIRFVERGIGSAILPATAMIDRPMLASAAIDHPALTRTAALSTRSGVRPSAAAGEMARVITASITRLTEPGSQLAKLVEISVA